MDKDMKKVLATISSAAIFLSLAASAYAQVAVDPCPKGTDGTDFSSLCALDADSIGTVITTIITVLLIGATIIALFFLIWNGIRWVISGGDKAKVDEARKGIIAAIIGLVLAFLAYFILSLVLGLFNINPSDLKLPSFTN